jgi:hypothetical protein
LHKAQHCTSSETHNPSRPPPSSHYSILFGYLGFRIHLVERGKSEKKKKEEGNGQQVDNFILFGEY